MLYAIATIGCIGGVQLKSQFDLYNKKKIKSMCHSYNLLMCHDFFQGNKSIPIYTLGK
ncbi:hypothetical protein GCM10010965_30320 [Caldalkalibacillus thermarum]|uniref:hypothetical protein n=1 Tax=Caldalkalibacillus thermarum TaxID=296745 RepID=UPI00198E043F|nr:hypothetical protein [Caldalkalibacillus thermarum]GGK35250.1 hypothetical protein GCM10010965_30320 [Caldalkalibacillus thermarum]